MKERDEGAAGAFLGVTRSLTGRRWRERPADRAVTREIELRHGLSEPFARALASRNLSVSEVERFLRPTLRSSFPDPSTFADMDRAAAILVDALCADRRVVVFADYDVDGATSAAQLVRWFRCMGKELPIYVPDRILEGYGPSPAAFRRLREQGVDLVVTVDCGASANDAVSVASEIGLDVVVVDHHLMRHTPPAAIALVNPNRPDCPSGLGVLAAAGVTFVLLAALNREARRRGLFVDRAEPDLRQWLDLVALGAICDVTQLVGFNRALVTQGLKVMAGWRNPGLAALVEVAQGRTARPGVFEAGFILGPRINAGGRVGRADLGARLLSTDDPIEAREIALRLDELNSQRKEVEGGIIEEAGAAIERDSNFNPDEPVIVVAREDWHPGVIGIVASRLRERYRKPVVVIGIDRQADIGRGSGRSQPGVNLGRAVQCAFEDGLLLSGGGHAMAAGLTLRPAMVPEFRAYLCESLNREVCSADLAEAIDVDALASPGDSASNLFREFNMLAPHGPGNSEPLFAFADLRVDHVAPLRGGHLRCVLSDSAGARIEGIAWRSSDTPIGARLLSGGGAIHVVGRLKRNVWGGRDRIELEVEDLADPRQLSNEGPGSRDKG